MWDTKRYDHIDQNEDNGEIQTKERYYKVRTCNILETLHDVEEALAGSDFTPVLSDVPKLKTGHKTS